MNTNTILLLLFSIVIAVGLSYFQYFYKAKKSMINTFLAFLRFISILCILLLLINPIISSKTFEIIKTPLVVAVDNSSSISYLKANTVSQELHKKIKDNTGLNNKFEILSYRFDSTVALDEAFDYKGKQTNIAQVASTLKSTNKNQKFPTILISDGNQTTGSDYVFGFDENNKVYPLVLGDTTQYLDVKIEQVNVNKYAFHKNKFPVEVFLNYSGTKNIQTSFTISQGNTTIVKQNVRFSASKKSEILHLLLPAEKVGLQVFNATITTLENEKNTYNNQRKFAVEIIDQKTEVGIVSTINHPDLGALKRSIQSNVSRKVSIVKPKDIKDLSNYNVLILYQPNAEFKSVFEANKNLKINTWIITGNTTDFNFLNQIQNTLTFKMTSQKEDYLATYNAQFNLFAIDNFGFDTFPPLENPFGSVTVNQNASILLSSRIRNVETNLPLFILSDNQGTRNAYLLGENTWKWRAKNYLDKKSFEEYDLFIDKTIQFLASNDSKKSLIVNHERFYNSGDALEITAQYFNKNYELDEKARLTIAVSNIKTKEVKKYDLLRDSNAFKVNLDGLSSGKYAFTVRELNSNASYSNSFEILDFDIEKQFVNPNLNQLNQLASQTKGTVFMPNQVDQLIDTLLEDKEYQPIQKAIVKNTPLIDWIWLLILLAISLSVEWFVRKYNGLL